MIKNSTTLQSNYITSRLQGRTGNMMFQIAHAYAKSIEFNRQFVVPKTESSSGHLEKTLFRKLDFNINLSNQTEDTKTVWVPFTYENVKPYDDCPTAYAGWFQSDKFFKNYSEVIRDLFSPTKEFVKRALIDFPFLNKSTVGAINVRRGDYLTQPRRHPVVTVDYINEAYNHLPNCDKIMVLSDDINWCKENLVFPNLVFVENYVDCDALWLLSLCDHFIISNSSFSWWGAYLSRSDKKVVVSPETWFGPDVNDDPKDIWCDDWIKIPTIWKDGFIHLKN